MRRIVINEPDGTVSIPLAFKRGNPATPEELAAHVREGHIYAKGPVTALGQLWVCSVCGQIFFEDETGV